MMGDGENIVIIGGGIAGVSAALKARQLSPSCNITILTQDGQPFYNRIGLVGVATGNQVGRQIFCYSPDFLRDKRIAYRNGVTVRAINAAAHLLDTSAGSISYNKLVLATGATPFMPPVPGLDKIGRCLWTLDEARQLASDLQNGSRSIAIIGGGILAIESALEFASRGHHVTIIEKEDHLMAAQVNLPAGALLENFVKSKNISIYCNTTVVSATDGPQLTLNNGLKLKTDLVLVQTGIIPDTKLAREAGIKCNRGIIVDDTMATSSPDIWACGNCVEFNNSLELLWNPSRLQGEVAGANLFGDHNHYQPQANPVHLKNSAFNLFSLGHWQNAPLVSQEQDGNNYRAFFFNREGVLVGAIMVGDITSYPQIEEALAKGYKVDPVAISTLPPSAIRPPVTDADGHQLTWDGRRWVCRQCGYSCEGPIPPAICPVCHVGRDQFIPA